MHRRALKREKTGEPKNEDSVCMPSSSDFDRSRIWSDISSAFGVHAVPRSRHWDVSAGMAIYRQRYRQIGGMWRQRMIRVDSPAKPISSAKSAT
jgi:hypothetical protein